MGVTIKKYYNKYKNDIGVFGTIIFGILSIAIAAIDKSFIIIGLLFLQLCTIIFLYIRHKQYLKAKKRLLKPKDVLHRRFEKIIKKRIYFISIEYSPFYWQEGANKDIVKGIGPDIMNRIFEPFNNVKLKEYTSDIPGYSWKTIFEEFADRSKKIDFIITPMYETRSRLFDYNVIYSIPLFYSDIGIYVNKENYTGDAKTYEEAIEFILKKHNNKNWGVAYLPGEISEILGKKLITKEKYEDDKHQNYSEEKFIELLEKVNSTEENSCDVVFMEVFKAKSIIEKKKLNLINILKTNQLIYPVSFAIRKEETALRNFINLRIEELRASGELNRIIKKNAELYGINEDDVKLRFIQSYNYKLIDNNYKENRILFSDRIKKEYDILDKVYGNYKSFQENLKKEIDNFSSNSANLKVLEIGCGTGWTSEIILQSSKNIDLIMIDNDPEMIDYARKNVKHKNINDDNFILSDIIDFLKSSNQKFDIIVSAYTIHNFPKEYREELFPLIYQALNDDSLFINADKYAPQDDESRIKALNYRINKFIEYLKNNDDSYSVINEWVSHYIDDQSPRKVMKEKESIQQLKVNGFKEVKFTHSEDELEMMKILTAKK